MILNIPAEFILLGLTLAGVAVFHKHSLKIAFTGLCIIILYRHFFQDFDFIKHVTGPEGEWKILLNLFGLLTGFSLLAAHFEDSKVPQLLPALLPDDWKGGFVLLLLIFILSAFLDNIAAALIGTSVASAVYKRKLHTGYLVAIVAASNAGGAGSVLGDTTTTMMWIAGIPVQKILHAFIPSVVAVLFFGIIAAHQQQKFCPIQHDPEKGLHINIPKIIVVSLILFAAVLTNVWFEFPALGVWSVIIAASFFIPTPWKIVRKSVYGSLFLLCLVLAASLMPVASLPAATWHSTFALGFISAFFDNIPLTKLAIDQGGYDWGLLAYAVGFGGSMLWFGSSAGVAVAGKFEEAKSTVSWIKNGWHVVVAYILGFAVLIMVMKRIQ